MTIYKVTKIEFDFTSDDDYVVSDEYKQEVVENTLNNSWMVEDEEELVDFISDTYGWCIKSIDYVEESYSLICFADDDSGDKVTEGTFNSVDDAWNHNNRMGSKWIFYPIRVVVDNNTGKIVSADDVNTYMVGLSLTELTDHKGVS